MTNVVTELRPEQAKFMVELVDLCKVTIPSLCALLAVVLGAWLAYRFAIRRLRLEKRLGFVKQQIEHFYSPMIGSIKRIRASSELRVKLSVACNTAWQKIYEEQSAPFEDHEDHFEPFKRQIEDENKRFPKYLLPLYDHMLDVFTKNYWLAEGSTKEFYKPFFRYVDLWHRYLDNAIPPRIFEEITIEEEPLVPFYKDLESNLSRLKNELR